MFSDTWSLVLAWYLLLNDNEIQLVEIESFLTWATQDCDSFARILNIYYSSVQYYS